MFEDASGRDLTQFKLWYSQAGTPRLKVKDDWDGARYRLELAQETPPTPGQPEKAPLVIPVAYGLLGPDGQAMAEGVLELDTAAQTFEWELPARPVPSLLRGFSAPVILERADDPAERVFLLAHDSDPFNKWEAGRTSALILLARMADDPALEPDGRFPRGAGGGGGRRRPRSGVQGAGAGAAARGGGDRARGGAGARARSAGDLGRAAAARGGGGAGARGAGRARSTRRTR